MHGHAASSTAAAGGGEPSSHCLALPHTTVSRPPASHGFVQITPHPFIPRVHATLH
ncbi:protein of unknown function [Sterolibacterium denitrificans]|uniref:Uncharacterized protein n=1 Tax=Sterolibacterium denitrificans TaxID=157592 RepID=A0A7Z7HTE8_9PROT|nr:protein of unknown function [Sterolibacterium denitrificans]